jgi:dihydroorotate dehydrogenase (NAD+) catalytic subunit
MPKVDFSLPQPLMNAAGSLGFAPDGRSGVNFSRFGAFVTNPISAGPRSPAQGRRFLPTASGLLLHSGHPNPGFNAVVRQYGPRWAHADLPIIVHLLGQHPDDLAAMVRRLEGMEGVMGIELGLPPGVDGSSARQLIEAALGELLLIVRLPDSAGGVELARMVQEVGVGAISLGAPRGLLYIAPDPRPGENVTYRQSLEGRLYGPAVLPVALRRVRELADLGISVIGSGGVYTETHFQAMLSAGASAVQVDTALWRRMPWLF